MIYRMATCETKPKRPTEITLRDTAYTAPGAPVPTHWFGPEASAALHAAAALNETLPVDVPRRYGA
jgi:hypothetical protein